MAGGRSTVAGEKSRAAGGRLRREVEGGTAPPPPLQLSPENPYLSMIAKCTSEMACQV